MKKVLIAILIVCVASFVILVTRITPDVPTNPSEIRYVPLGDSYTIGEGVTPKESWPTVLTNTLRENGVSISLITNPAVSGYTTQDVLERELPIFESSQPTFGTLLIGTNDWAQGVSNEDFRERFALILDKMQEILPDNRILVLTLPDFSVTPAGKNFISNRDISQGIREYNEIIIEESVKRDIPIVDLFPLSQETDNDPTRVVSDGLHPSAREYQRWVELIYPTALKLLEQGG